MEWDGVRVRNKEFYLGWNRRKKQNNPQTMDNKDKKKKQSMTPSVRLCLFVYYYYYYCFCFWSEIVMF